MRICKLPCCITILLLCAVNQTFAQTDVDSVDYYSMSLEELMNIPITVASSKALTSRESPGIVTLITSDEIASSGARDLIDVLRLVPGFEFGVDVQGVVGLGLRGNWGHEGKILILWDGMEMNERSFATTQLGQHFPLEQIDRIEIIRGPGSAMYGGYAELGVINITSKKGKALQGGMISTMYSQMKETYGRKEANAMFGNSKDDLAYDVKFTLGEGTRSDRTYTDIYGTPYDMGDNSHIKNRMANAGMKYKGLNVRLLYEDYTVFQRDLFDAIMPEDVETKFKSIHADVKYEIKPSEKLTITPRVRYKSQQPWRSNDNIAATLDAGDFGGVFSDKKVTQTLAEVTVNADVSEAINITGGIQYYQDKGTTVAGHEYDITGTTGVDFNNFSAYGQSLLKLGVVNLTLGACFNHHEQFGSSFVPRIGLTKVVDKFHAKLLFSQAFRAPSIQNIDLNHSIKPELTTVFEIETGYQLSSNVLLVANFYNISINDPIVYFYDGEADIEGYANYDETGTLGAEAELRFKSSFGNFSLNYSYYSANGKNTIESYKVPGNDDRLLAFPQGKMNASGSFKLTEKISFNPSFTYLGERNGYENETAISTFDPVLFANINFVVKDLLAEGLELGAGVYNVTDNDYMFIQPYNNAHAPLPQPSREIVVRLKYRFKM
ncbi:MAG TPA: TonB-dependent receptor plug domain-containing protein [Chryseosolibacter sp.]|nr:TonB-dependent receptor plug domain-containing protein [Chryseosolibacter sp.]